MLATRVENIALAQIKTDQRAQPRAHLNTDVTSAYVEALADGATFPPLVVFFDGSAYWLADGFHRRYAALDAGLTELPCEIHDGGLREAILHSCGANATHGYPRSNDDKRRAVVRLLEDEEWSKWSDREIARQCRVDHKTVAKLRPETVTGEIPSEPPARTYKTKHGTPAQMKTAAIGKSNGAPGRTRKTAKQDPAQRPTRGKAATCAKVKDAIVILASLPPAGEVVGYFKGTDLSVIVDERVSVAADWLAEFSEIWSDQNAEDEG